MTILLQKTNPILQSFDKTYQSLSSVLFKINHKITFMVRMIMRKLTLSAILIGTTLSPALFAQENKALNYNVVNIQANASRQVANDQMRAILYIEQTNKKPAELANQITQIMNQAQSIARHYPQVKIETGTQSTTPIYDNDSNKLKEWRAHAEIQLESTDFKATSQLISELQQNFQIQSLNFTVSDQQRKKVENELMVEASKNFQQRAQAITQAWNKTQYNLVDLSLNTSSYFPQPITHVAMAKFAAAAPAQDMSAGESKITVNANGSIQFQ